MPVQRTLLTTTCLAALASSFCAGDGQSGAGPIAPATLQAPPVATAMIMVHVDKICAGRNSNIRVSIDVVTIGVTNPGEPDVSQLVTLGDTSYTPSRSAAPSGTISHDRRRRWPRRKTRVHAA